MPSKNPAQQLADIVENVDAIYAFTAELDFESFLSDQKAVYAVVRALEIISEASRRLPKTLQDRHPDIDWTSIAAASNIYRHEYDAVDETLIWHTVRHELTALRGAASEELARSQSDQA